jgi:hypothetical protein
MVASFSRSAILAYRALIVALRSVGETGVTISVSDLVALIDVFYLQS